MKIKYKILIPILTFVVLISGVCSYLRYLEQRNTLIKGIDTNLYTAAMMARAILPENYHDGIMDINSVSKMEFDKTVERYNKLCVALGMEYLWSLMKIDGKIVFTSSTSPDKNVANQKHAHFFDVHTNPEAYQTLFLTQKTQYQMIADKWGKIRVVLIPFKDSLGRQYLFGSSKRVSDVDVVLNRCLRESIYIGLFFLFLGLWVSYLLATMISRPFNYLIAETNKMAKGGYDKKIDEKGFHEQIELARSFNRMRSTIKEQISALSKSQEKLRITLDSIGDAVIVTDTTGCVTRMNPIAENLTGWCLSDAKGHPLADVFCIINSKTGMPPENPVQKVLQTGTIVGLANHTKLIAKNGKEYHISDSAAPIKDDGGELTGVVMVFRDITDEYLMQKEIQQNQERFNKVLEAIPDMVSVHDRSMTILYSNWNGFGAVPGEKRKINTKCYKTYRGYESICPDCQAKTVFKTKKIFQTEFELPDGRWLDFRVIPILDSDGKCTLFAEWVRDITDRKLSEKILQESEKRFRTLFEKTADAIFVVDRKTGKYLDANDSALILTGRNIDELRQLSTREVCPEGADDRLQKINQPQETQELGEVFYKRPNGEKRVAMLSSVLHDNKTVIAIARDITNERIMLDQLMHAQKMEAIGTLAGGIAHDFNNILSGIFGYSQLAQMNRDKPEKIKTHIDQIMKAARRATDMVQQILTFSRQTEYQKKPLKIYLEVKEALKLLRSSMPSTMEIVGNVDSRTMVLADPTKIHQVVMNLCTNSYQAMRKTGGILTVSLTDIIISEPRLIKNRKMPAGRYVKFEVSDTGHGMAQNVLEKAFDPYFTTKKKGEGTGLGLAIVQAIVDEHDGFLDVFSRQGRGTTFFIYFPSVAENVKFKKVDPKNVKSVFGNETIMVVDDEKDIREILKELFEDYGYRVFMFENGVEALKEFEENPSRFDLVVTDMTMPGLTGDKFSREILKINPEIPIILCTGFSENISEIKALDIGIKKFVQKPADNRELLIMIRDLFDEKMGNG